MPRKTKASSQADALRIGELYLTAAVAVADNSEEDDVDEAGLAEDSELAENGLEEILLSSAQQWIDITTAFNGTGSRGPYNQIPKSKDFFTTCLQAPDRRFRNTFRIGRPMFDTLVDLLGRDDSFISTGKKPQRHVKFQLGTFLIRYGARGSDTLHTAQQLSIGHGTVHDYCRRVGRAIRRLAPQFLSWPTPERKAVISAAILEHQGFPSCVGSGDGSLIRFSEQPVVNGPMYQCRKKFYGTNIQATVDHERRFTSYEMGWPGAVPDVKIFKQSHIWTHRQAHFKDGEYILMDKGYPSTPYTVRPFNVPELEAARTHEERQRMGTFNRRLSSVRIASEHVFGLLKGRFPSLKELGCHRDVQEAYKVIEALMVLHNICIAYKDKPENIWDFDPMDDFDNDPDWNAAEGEEDPEVIGEVIADAAAIPEWETDAWLREQGRIKRLLLLDLIEPV